MFYILTCGSTASVWLARALSRHPEIVCFHGKRTITANPTINSSEPAARQLVRELGHLYSISEGEKVFGAIHGYAVAEIAPEIAAVEGAFAAMIRHPITRVNSFFHQEAKAIGTIDLPGDDIYRPFRQDGAYQAEIDELTSQSPLTAYAHVFSALCNSVLTEDTFILENMDEQDIFQYEKIVVNPAYFKTCFETLAEGCRHAIALLPLPLPLKPGRVDVRLECTQEYLDRVFTMGNINPKKSGAEPPEEILARWPNIFKSIFVRQLENQGGKDAVDRYTAYGYRLPDDVEHTLVRRSPVPLAHLKPSGPVTSWAPAPIVDAEVEQDECALAAHNHGALKGTSGQTKNSTKQMLAILKTERAAHADRIRDLQATLDAERDAAIVRIRELESDLEAERRAQAGLIADLQDTLQTERDAFVARIRGLEAELEAERRAQATQVASMQEAFAAERQAAVARIPELERTLQAEHDAFVARIKELEAELEGERRAQAMQVAGMQEAFAAERQAAVARIRELERSLQAEHDAFVARIRELEAELEAVRCAQARQVADMQETRLSLRSESSKPPVELEARAKKS